MSSGSSLVVEDRAALHLTAINGDVETAQILMEAGASIWIRERVRCAVFVALDFLFATHFHPHLFFYLVNTFSSTSPPAHHLKSGQVPFHFAGTKGDVEMLKFMYEVDPNIVTARDDVSCPFSSTHTLFFVPFPTQPQL